MKFEFVDETAEKGGYNARIKVLGIGGAGNNAINNMINSNLRGVEFLVANTDCQDLERSCCSKKIQLGPSVTMGLGAGADPEIGKTSAEESINELRESLRHSDMVFLAAGMGGGTGTGATPVAARECRESGALTVAVVTKPFEFEGKTRMKRAMEGIEALKEQVDSLIIIPNERLKTLGEKATPFMELFTKADDVLLQAVKGISDLIINRGYINLDFADVKNVMKKNGSALMGMGKASGEGRACEAAQMAINSPLLEDISIEGAKGLLINISGPPDMTWDEVDQACNYIKNEVNDNAEVFFGMVFDETLQDEVLITVIATGIDGPNEKIAASKKLPPFEDGIMDRVRSPQKVVNIRQATTEDLQGEWTVRMNGVDLDTPTWQRDKVSLSNTMDNDEKKSKKGFLDRFKFKEGLDYPTFLRVKPD
ncbi:MAG TPA: cell division protein FtsZ [Deltaproteobacteria bacterium]|nr:cell division protein FtsZ [Deltaproteobacteria bacterium]